MSLFLKARFVAVAAVVLAAVAIPASAASFLVNQGDPQFGGLAGLEQGAVGAIPLGSVNGLQGISFFGTASGQLDDCGDGTYCGTLTYSAHGTFENGSPFVPFVMPELEGTWVFTATGTYTWDLEFLVGERSNMYDYNWTEGNSGPILTNEPSQLITEADTWAVTLNVHWANAVAQNVTLDIPAGSSIDIEALGEPSGVPEPSVLYMIVPGLALIGLKRFIH